MEEPPLKIMYLNPAPDMFGEDTLFADLAFREKRPGTEVHVASLPRSVGLFSHIEYRSYEAMVTRAMIQAVRAASLEGFDALVIGCFYDTALLEAREISDSMVVTAPCEAAVDLATTLSNRFGVVIGREKWAHQMGRTIEGYGKKDSFTGFYPLGLGVDDFQKDHGKTRERMVEAARTAVERDRAESLILGCTMEAGFHRSLQEEIGVPVIDPSIAAIARAEHFGLLRRSQGWIPSRRWSCEAPPESELKATGVFDVPKPFGNRIVVQA